MVKITIITGNAGTGKSHILTKYINLAVNKNKSFVVLAFTHSAKNNIKEIYNKLYNNNIDDKFMTIHKYFKIDVDKNIIRHNKFEHIDYMFIDEYSLISIDLFNIIFDAICVSVDKLILCGDYKQLHSVDNKEYITYDNLYKYLTILNNKYVITPDIIKVLHHFDTSILSLPIIKNNIEDLLILKEQKRSEDNAITLINDIIFKGCDIPKTLFVTKPSIPNLILNNNYVFIASKYSILQEIHNIICNYTNKEIIDINQQTVNYKSGLKKIKLYKGQEITITTNTDNFTNGDTYAFIEYSEQNEYILLYSELTNEYKYLYKIEEDDKLIDTYKNKYFPILPTYLSTFHKAQGRTYENVIICVDDLFDFTMLYTGMTRAQKDILFYTKQTDPNIEKQNTYFDILDDLINSIYEGKIK